MTPKSDIQVVSLFSGCGGLDCGFETVTADLLARLLAQRIRLTQYTHSKEEQRFQRVRAADRPG